MVLSQSEIPNFSRFPFRNQAKLCILLINWVKMNPWLSCRKDFSLVKEVFYSIVRNHFCLISRIRKQYR